MSFTFTVETGSAAPGANAYISVAEANDYHTGRGNDAWASATNSQKQTAIVRATDYIDKRFGRRFVGILQSATQGVAWPRIDAYDRSEYLLTGVPAQVKKACAEYALRALAPTADLLPDASEATGEVQSQSTTVGPISESKSFATSQNRAGQSGLVSDSAIPQYPAADLWLEELVRTSGMRRVVRG